MFTSEPKFVELKFTPGFNAENPGIVILGVNEFFEIMATVCASTSNFTMLYDKSSVPIIVSGVAPVFKPWLYCGPISTQPEPVNKYNCWAFVSTHKSPEILSDALGWLIAFFNPPDATQFAPS